jgi:hypothetical protein
VGVEKLAHLKMAEKNFALGCPTNDFSVFRYIFYPPNFRCFDENGLFQHPRDIASTDDSLRDGGSFTTRLRESDRHWRPIARLFVSKGPHGIDLRRVAGGNVAGDECNGHQEQRHQNDSQHIVSFHTVEKLGQ